MPARLFFLIGWLTATVGFAQGTFTFTQSSMGAITSDYYDDHQNFAFAAPSASLGNYSAVQATFSAPPGYAWLVLAWHTLDCVVAYGSAANALPVPMVDSANFNFVPGMSSTVNVSTGPNQFIYETGIGVDAAVQFGGDVEFTQATITLQYAPLHGWQVAQRPLSSFSQAYFDIYKYPGLDRGQHLFLLPIPEPSVPALAVLGMASLMTAPSGRRPPTRPELESGYYSIPQ